MEQNPMTEFELCRELNRFGFPQKRRDDAWYFLRPDMLISITSIDSLYGVDKRPYGYSSMKVESGTYGPIGTPRASIFEQLIYYPTLEDFQEYLGGTLQNVVLSETSFFIAYINGIHEGETIRANGVTMWKALASAIYAKMLAKNGAMPPINPDESENAQDTLTPPQN